MVISGKEEIAKIYRSGNLGEWDMTKKGGKSLWQGIIDFSSAHRTMMISGAEVLCWIAIVVQLVCVWSLWYVVLPVAMVPSLAYFASNFLITDKDEKKKAVKAYYGSWVSSVTAAVNSLLILIVPTFLVFDKVMDLRRIVCVIADILLLVSLGYMIRRPLMKVRLAKMIERNLPLNFRDSAPRLNKWGCGIADKNTPNLRMRLGGDSLLFCERCSSLSVFLGNKLEVIAFEQSDVFHLLDLGIAGVDHIAQSELQNLVCYGWHKRC